MKIALRFVGVLLIIFGVINLGAFLYLIGSDELRSSMMVGVRYSLMCAAGVGFLLLRKWGALVFFGSVLINWIAYFVVYDGVGYLVPLWMTLPIPIAIAVLSFFTWDKLEWW